MEIAYKKGEIAEGGAGGRERLACISITLIKSFRFKGYPFKIGKIERSRICDGEFVLLPRQKWHLRW